MLVVGVVIGVTTPEEVESLSLGTWRVCLLAQLLDRPWLWLCRNNERLVVGVVIGVTTPEEGRELASRAAESMSLSPTTR
jgi:hypothetical protein